MERSDPYAKMVQVRKRTNLSLNTTIRGPPRGGQDRQDRRHLLACSDIASEKEAPATVSKRLQVLGSALAQASDVQMGLVHRHRLAGSHLADLLYSLLHRRYIVVVLS
jgi:hypothetical protein